MNINLFPFTILWMFLAAVVVGLIFYRMWIAKDEDDTLHVMEGDDGKVAQQTVMAQKLEIIDHWGQTLTVAAEACSKVDLSNAIQLVFSGD